MFPIAQIFDANFLTTYSFPSYLENRELNKDSEYLLVIDTNGIINLNTFNEVGYSADVIDKPGNIGYPEAVETLVGEPKAVLFREIQTSSLLKVAGWNINIGNKNIPNPPLAVTRPAALLLFSLGKCFEIIGVKIVPAAPAKPKPTSKPRFI